MDAAIRTVQKHTERNEFEEALALCDSLIANSQTQAAGYRERAEVRLAMALPEEAVKDLYELISLDSAEPADHYNLGISLLKTKKPKEAVAAFSEAIELGEKEQFDYYTNSSLMHRAEAYLQLSKWREAEADCLRVPQGYSSFLPGLGVKTREQMLARSERMQN